MELILPYSLGIRAISRDKASQIQENCPLHYISGWAIPWWGTLLWGRGTSGLLELFPMGSISLLALRVPLMEPNLQKVWALRAADTSQEPGACYGNRFRIMPASQASPCDIKNTS